MLDVRLVIEIKLDIFKFHFKISSQKNAFLPLQKISGCQKLS